jgi:hypothetical protein
MGHDSQPAESCPGDGKCETWDATAGDFETKSRACIDCTKCRGNPPKVEIENSEDEIDEITDIVDEIEEITNWENAGHKTAWSVYPFFYQILHYHWRRAENQVKNLRAMELQNFLKEQAMFSNGSRTTP